MDRFRLIVPELITPPSESIPDHDVQHKVDSVLWRGEDYPGQNVIDAAIEDKFTTEQRIDFLANLIVNRILEDKANDLALLKSLRKVNP
jgi:hypothetical protein